MQKLFTVTIVLTLAAPFAALADKEDKIELCSHYEFAGLLSKDLTKSPVLEAFSPNGIPLNLNLMAKAELSMTMLAMNGKNVVADVLVEKMTSRRTYSATLEKIQFVAPDKLGAGTGNKMGKLLKAASCK